MTNPRQIIITQRIAPWVAERLIKEEDDDMVVAVRHAALAGACQYLAERHLAYSALNAHKPRAVLREFDDHGYAVEPYWLAVTRVTATLIKPVDN